MKSALDFPPCLFGQPSEAERIRAMMTAAISVLRTDSPGEAINAGILMIVAGMHSAEPGRPDNMANEIADCIVRSYAALMAWEKDRAVT